MKRIPLTLLSGLMLLAVSGRADIVMGSDPTTPGTYAGTDFCTGCLFAYAAVPANAVGLSVTSWSFYAYPFPSDPPPGDPTGAGNLITPLLFQNSGSGIFTVIGVGTTRVNPGGGGQLSYSFGLTSGTDVLGAGDYLGWRDGGTAAGSGNNGTISLSLGPTPAGPGIFYSGYPGYAGPVAAGDPFTFTNASTDSRTYSVDFTATPEPMYFGALGIGLGILALVRRRRVSARS